MPKAAALGVPNLITFFGNRQGRGDTEAIANCVAGLTRSELFQPGAVSPAPG